MEKTPEEYQAELLRLYHTAKGFDPRKLLADGAQAIKDTVKEKMELFGSVGKA